MGASSDGLDFLIHLNMIWCTHLPLKLGVASSDARLWPTAWLLASITLLMSTKSLMVMQRVHLKTLSPLGHLDIAPHVMQLPDAKSLSAGLPFTFGGPKGCAGLFCLDPGPKPNISASESESESKSSGDGFFGTAFLLAENKDGKGWLIERP